MTQPLGDDGGSQEQGGDAGRKGGPVPGPGGDLLVLPDTVRRRVATYAADVLRALQPNQVPSTVRFAAQWRAGPLPRGFADRLAAATAADQEFRQRVGAQLVEADPLARSVAEGESVTAGDPQSVAALLYLIRPQGWRDRLEAAMNAAAAPAADNPEAARLRREVGALTARLAKVQQRREREVAEARAAEAETRSRLSETVERLREQLAAATAAGSQAERARDQLQRDLAERDRELRRARGQLEQSKMTAEHGKHTDRDARLAASARAKALLEVLQGAVAGLVDELAPMPGTVSPADLVPAAAPAEPILSKRLLTAGDLADALTLPRCHLLVDGYNVSKGIWPQAPLQQQRERIIGALASLQARTGAEITVVFDGAKVGAVPAVSTRAVRVRFSAAGELADRVLVRLVAAEPKGRPMVVASSDAALSSGSRSAGARTVDSAVLADLLGLGRTA